jgi:hypothetical protein
MRNTIQNVGLLVIVLTLSAIFLLQFGGPQSQGCSQDSGAQYAAKVYGDTITLGEMKSAYILANGPRYSTQAARDMKLKSWCCPASSSVTSWRARPPSSGFVSAKTT